LDFHAKGGAPLPSSLNGDARNLLGPRAPVTLSGYLAASVNLTFANPDLVSSVEGPSSEAPALRLGMGNGLVMLPAVPLTHQWTFDVYVKLPLEKSDNWQVLAGGSREEFLVASKDGQVLGRLDVQGRFAPFKQFTLKDLTDGWHRLTLVATGYQQALYIDGKRESQCVGQASTDWHVVGNGAPHNEVDLSWRGDIAKMRLFNYAMTDAEVEAIGTNVAIDGGAYDL